MGEGLSDQELVALVFKQKERYRELVERYQHKLLRYVYRLGAGNVAEDLVQEAFLKAYQNLASFDRSLSFSAWIYRLTHNVVMTHFRKQKIRPEGNVQDLSEAAWQNIWGEADTEKTAVHSLDGVRLRQAMKSLKPLYRDVLTLRYFEELEYKEISDVLQLPVNSVAVYLNRAKKQLRDLYGQR